MGDNVKQFSQTNFRPDGIHWKWDESEGDWVEIPELKGVTIVT